MTRMISLVVAVVLLGPFGCDSTASDGQSSSALGDARPGGTGGGTGGVTSGGTGGTGGASQAGASDGSGEECPTEYDLPHYAGDTGGLCPPGESTTCTCLLGAAAAVVVQCTPDGSACIYFSHFCPNWEPLMECGWHSCTVDSADPACDPELVSAAENSGGGVPCASDRDCLEGHYCNVRVHNRMFCDHTQVFRRADAGADGG